MPQPTVAQTAMYQFHRRLCTIGIPGLGPIGQSMLEHRVLMGSLSAPSATGNQIYSGPGPTTADIISTTTKVWLVHEPMVMRAGAASGQETQIGHQAIPMEKAQFPVIDDFGNQVAVAEDDLIIDASGSKYKIANPIQTPDASLWSMQLVKQR